MPKTDQPSTTTQVAARARLAAVQREIFECNDLRVTFGLSEAARASQRGAIAKAYEQAVKARGETPSPEPLDREYTPITSGLTACGSHAGRDFKLIVGSALLELTMAGGGRPSLDIIVVKTGAARVYCVLVTEAGAERIKAVARKMTFEDAEWARASRPPKGAEADAVKHNLDALAELGLTNVLGLALPDTRELTSEQVEALQAYLSAAKPKPAALQQQGDPYELVKSAFGRLSEAPTNWPQAAVFASATDDPQDEDMRRRAPVLLGISAAIVRDCPAACPHSSCLDAHRG